MALALNAINSVASQGATVHSTISVCAAVDGTGYWRVIDRGTLGIFLLSNYFYLIIIGQELLTLYTTVTRPC